MKTTHTSGSGTMKAQHTKTPWQTDKEFDHMVILGADGIMVADCCILGKNRKASVLQANARHIVKCINNHGELLYMLAIIKDVLNYVVNGKGIIGGENEIIKQAKQVIINVKGR